MYRIFGLFIFLLTVIQFISKRPTIVMFHGNGGNVGHRIPLAAIFYNMMRCNVFMMSYRGYANLLLI